MQRDEPTRTTASSSAPALRLEFERRVGCRWRRRAIYRAKTDALLALRDQTAINDRVYTELQLELDRANADLREG